MTNLTDQGEWWCVQKLFIRTDNSEIWEIFLNRVEIINLRVRIQWPIRVPVNEITHAKIGEEPRSTYIGKVLAKNAAGITFREVKREQSQASYNLN